MKKFLRVLRFVLQAVVSVGVLIWLFAHLGMGDIWDSLRNTSWTLILSGCGLYVGAQVLSAWRWWRMADILRFDVSLGRCINLYFLGMFYNIFLPSGYGGDIVKLFYLAGHHKPSSKRLSAVSIFLDRFTGLIAILTLGGIASLALGLRAEVLGGMMAAGLVVCTLIVVLGVLLLARSARIPRKVRVVALILCKYAYRFVPIVLVSIVVQLLNVFIYVLIFQQLNVPLTLAEITFGYALVTLATLIPLSVGGLGIRESGWVGILKLFNIPVHAGVGAGILYFAVQTIVALGGIYSFFKASKNLPSDDEADDCEDYE